MLRLDAAALLMMLLCVLFALLSLFLYVLSSNCNCQCEYEIEYENVLTQNVTGWFTEWQVEPAGCRVQYYQPRDVVNWFEKYLKFDFSFLSCFFYSFSFRSTHLHFF